jgi:hypothetical protein
VRAKTSQERRASLERQLAGWEIAFPHIQAERDRAAAEAHEQARRAERARLQAERERRQAQSDRENDRARLASLELQWSAAQQAAVRTEQQRRHQAFWRDRLRACDELIAMTQPPQPAVAAQSVEPYGQGSAHLGAADFDPELMADPARWW